MIPHFSVVIPTYQQPALLLKCLDALGRQRLPRDQFELIVVDDANSPETAAAVALFTRQIARAGGPLEVRYLAQPDERGPAAARNRGWRAARGRVVAFTDEDCLPQANWLASVLPSFERGAQVITGQMHLTLPDGTAPYSPKSLYLDSSELISANCFCRKSALERVGGFEEAFDLSWREDSDLQFKFIQAGIPIIKCPEAVVVHPMRETPWYAPLANEQKSRYDALLYKRHPELFRQRIETDRALVLEYYASVLGVLMGVLGALISSSLVSVVGFGIWGVLSVNLIRRRWPDQPSRPLVQQTILTSLATPFLAVYWRLYGAIKYRVLYW
ncbi:glycosyltransferase family 2 protein [Spirosoma sordidisoli]|uniref:Glycosyltransferase n=1 Tax=Spirosoma sordidisoli TaxID=2502893 RepID=A0A4Q2UPN4_9BACT|nr:glycosyltransferase [Spirosoma sordidisoli]RYC68779.1 glycosyltransferase [Spirosoma sordidisoli]